MLSAQGGFRISHSAASADKVNDQLQGTILFYIPLISTCLLSVFMDRTEGHKAHVSH